MKQESPFSRLREASHLYMQIQRENNSFTQQTTSKLHLNNNEYKIKTKHKPQAPENTDYDIGTVKPNENAL